MVKTPGPAEEKRRPEEGVRLPEGRRPSLRIRSLVDRFEGTISDAAGPSRGVGIAANQTRRVSLATVPNDTNAARNASRGGIAAPMQGRRQSLPDPVMTTSMPALSPGFGRVRVSERGETIRAAVGGMNWEPITAAQRGHKSPPPAYRYWSNPTAAPPLNTSTPIATSEQRIISRHDSTNTTAPGPRSRIASNVEKLGPAPPRSLTSAKTTRRPSPNATLSPSSIRSASVPPSSSSSSSSLKHVPAPSTGAAAGPSRLPSHRIDRPALSLDTSVPPSTTRASRLDTVRSRQSVLILVSPPITSAREGLPTLSDKNQLPNFSPNSKIFSRQSVKNAPNDNESNEETALDNLQDADDIPLIERSSAEKEEGEGNTRQAELDVKPFPAKDIFAAGAAPLFLPELDAYLASDPIFVAPQFSCGRQLSTEEEVELYGYASKKGKRGQMEVCGAQLAIPRVAAEKGTRKGKRYEEDRERGGEEGDGQLRAESQALIGEANDQEEKREGPMTSAANSSVNTISEGVPSGLSTQSNPITRLDMFPPLMLLRSSSLNELKSNAVGPRAPPGGLLGKIPGIGSILGTIVDFVIGMEGSTFAANIFRLELFSDFVQIMALNLHFTPRLSDLKVQRILLYYVPSFLALNFTSILDGAIVILVVYMGIVALLLYAFWNMTSKYNPNRTIEGYSGQPWLFRLRAEKKPQRRSRSQAEIDPTGQSQKSTAKTKFVNISIVMLLTVLYIPLSKLCVDALTWNADFWPVPNPYTTEENPNPPSLGDPSVYRDPLDFCYTTTMKRDEFNWAFVVIPLSVMTLLGYTLWYPYQLRKTIKTLLPTVHEFNELGLRRTPTEIENEYQRVLDNDATPLNFLYNAYRRQLGNYKPLYIFCFKLSTLLIISVFTKDNCLWRSQDTRVILVIQQTVLICLQAILMAAHITIQPFVDPIANRSEMVSRIGYVLTATIGLLVALQVQGSTVYNTTILYIIQAFSYGGNVYFSLAGAGWMEHLIKRWQSRVDFSIDVFSPTVNLQKHIKRRVWEETLSTVLLCAAPYHMPLNHLVTFSIHENWPPYLLNFEGSAAERHVENLKILKTVGLPKYRKAVEELRLNDDRAMRLKEVMRKIQRSFAGPDAYWRPMNPPFAEGVSSWFGKAFLVPFPPTLLFRYDESKDSEERMVALTKLEELEFFVWQNERADVKERRWVRLALRALDGQEVFCPFTDAARYGEDRNIIGLPLKQRYTLARPIYYSWGRLRVKRNEHAAWPTYNFDAGFDVEVTYPSGQRQDPEGLTIDRRSRTIDGAAAFGLHDTFALTGQVVHFLRENRAVLESRMPMLQDMLQHYRDNFATEAIRKEKVMDYAFLTDIFDRSCLSVSELRSQFEANSSSAAVRAFPHRYRAATSLLFERLTAINRSKVHQWWWLYWDDLWRQNSRDYKLLRRHRRFFSPAFPSSIAYRPMPRADLERHLAKRGLWIKSGSKGVFTRGSLNAIYFFMDELVFAPEKQSGEAESQSEDDDISASSASSLTIAVGPAVPLGLATLDGKAVEPVAFESVDASLDALSRFTGGGTTHDRSAILNRRAWTWTEQRLSRGKPDSRLARAQSSILQWLAIRPYPVNMTIRNLYLYLALEEDPTKPGAMRYVLPKHKDMSMS